MDPRVKKMAAVLVNYSIAVQPGEKVLFRGTSPLAQPLMRLLTEEALKAGGHPINYVHMSGEASTVLTYGAEGQIEYVNPLLKLAYETFDKIIRIEADDNSAEMSGFAAPKQQAWARRLGGLLSIQMLREGNGSLKRCTTLFPTPAYAKDAGMTVEEYENFVYNACMVHLDDPVAYWKQYAAEQQKLCDWLNGKKKLHVRGKNIDMEMSIDGRIWENADGRANFPDGEIFTGPVEDSVNGWVHFTFPAIYNGNVVKGAKLEFKNGKVVKATADENQDFLLAALDTDEGSRTLGEFAIGTNKGINRFTGHILFDEKIHGTVHMALGRAYPQTNAVNKSAIHWDMICDMMDGGEIIVDGVRFYENGNFLVGQ
ncbi:MAG: aminopeptidase [Anaerolineae bacterium]|nr:aminopeptidase [Anaerolineae bacterium]